MSQCRMDKSDIRGEYPKSDGYDMNLDFFFIRSIWIWIWIYYFYLGLDMDFEKSDPNPI